jgi:hypothetical protein
MAKVIVERPRQGGGAPFPLRAQPDCNRLEIDEWQRRQSIRRPWLRGRAKGLNENLAPLRRYLQSQIGRPWDEIYSEICERINRNSAVQLHIWQHLMDYVCTDPYVASGLVKRGWRYHLYLVDPKTGQLRATANRWPRFRQPKPVPNPDRVRIDENNEYRRLNGLWYRLKLAPVPAHRIGYDFGLNTHLTHLSDESLRRFYGAAVYAVGKRQLNKREIRQLRLNEIKRSNEEAP